MGVDQAMFAPRGSPKRIQGRYERLLVPQLHRLIERWYYTESRPVQQRMFKNVMRGVWDCANNRLEQQIIPTEKDVMIAATYTKGVIKDEYLPAVEKFVANQRGSGLLEDFRSTFGSLHVVRKRWPTTQYTADYPLYAFKDFINARPVTYTREVQQLEGEQSWERFRTRHPKPPPAAESRVVAPSHISGNARRLKPPPKELKGGSYTPVPKPPGYRRFPDHSTPPPDYMPPEVRAADNLGRALFKMMKRPQSARPKTAAVAGAPRLPRAPSNGRDNMPVRAARLAPALSATAPLA